MIFEPVTGGPCTAIMDARMSLRPPSGRRLPDTALAPAVTPRYGASTTRAADPLTTPEGRRPGVPEVSGPESCGSYLAEDTAEGRQLLAVANQAAAVLALPA